MASYRYVKNVKVSWDQTVQFTTVDINGTEVAVKMGDTVDLDPKTAKDLSEYFVLEKIKEEATHAVANQKRIVRFIDSQEVGE